MVANVIILLISVNVIFISLSFVVVDLYPIILFQKS